MDVFLSYAESDGSITGVASGSYSMSRVKTEENLKGNLHWLVEIGKEYDSDFIVKSLERVETVDSLIREFLLHELFEEVFLDVCGDELRERFDDVPDGY